MLRNNGVTKSKRTPGYALLVATASQYQSGSRVPLTSCRVLHTQLSPPQPHFPFLVYTLPLGLRLCRQIGLASCAASTRLIVLTCSSPCSLRAGYCACCSSDCRHGDRHRGRAASHRCLPSCVAPCCVSCAVYAVLAWHGSCRTLCGNCVPSALPASARLPDPAVRIVACLRAATLQLPCRSCAVALASLRCGAASLDLAGDSCLELAARIGPTIRGDAFLRHACASLRLTIIAAFASRAAYGFSHAASLCRVSYSAWPSLQLP